MSEEQKAEQDAPIPTVPAGMNLLIGLVGLLSMISILQFLATMGFLANSAPPPAKTKWEYKVQSVSDLAFETEANALGKEGWQVVSARRAGSSGSFSYEFVLMRPAK